MRKIGSVLAVLLVSGFQLSAEIPTVHLTIAHVVSTPMVRTPTIVVPTTTTPAPATQLPMIWSKAHKIMGSGWDEKYPYPGTALGREWSDLQKKFNATPLPLPEELEARILQYHRILRGQIGL